MNKLKCEETLFKVVQYYDLDDFIKEHYDVPAFEIVSDMEYNNDSCYKMTVEKKALDKYGDDKLEKFIHSKGSKEMYMLYILMQDMCNRDLIKSGQYLVVVSW